MKGSAAGPASAHDEYVATLDPGKQAGAWTFRQLFACLASCCCASPHSDHSLTHHHLCSLSQVPLPLTLTATVSRELLLAPNLLTPSMLPLWTPESKLVRSHLKIEVGALGVALHRLWVAHLNRLCRSWITSLSCLLLLPEPSLTSILHSTRNRNH